MSEVARMLDVPLPRDVEAEAQLLWLLMIHLEVSDPIEPTWKRTCKVALKQLRPEDFFESFNAWVFAQLKSGKTVKQIVTVKNAGDILREIWLPAVRNGAFDWNVNWYADRIKETSKKRRRVLAMAERLRLAVLEATK